jgi:heptosyltransferase III
VSIKDAVSNNATVAKTPRVLIFLLGSLGDTLVALPSLHLIARCFPHAERRVLTNFSANQKMTPIASLLDGTGLIHGYFRFPTRFEHITRIKQFVRLAGEIRAWKPDLLVYLHEQRGRLIAFRDVLLFHLLGIPRTVGIPRTGELQRAAFDPDTGRFEQRCEYLARSLASIGNPRLADRASWSLSLSAAETTRARAVIEPLGGYQGLLAMSIGTKVDANDWGDHNWGAFLRELSEKLPGWALVALGAPVERERTSALLAAWHGPRLNLCGDLTVRESGAVLGLAKLFIGHDSGPMHLAASVGTRCAAIFSARNPPGRWFPYGESHTVFYKKTECSGCGLNVCVEFKKKCITAIAPSEVSDAVLLMLSAKPVRIANTG